MSCTDLSYRITSYFIPLDSDYDYLRKINVDSTIAISTSTKRSFEMRDDDCLHSHHSNQYICRADVINLLPNCQTKIVAGNLDPNCTFQITKINSQEELSFKSIATDMYSQTILLIPYHFGAKILQLQLRVMSHFNR